MAPDLNKLMRQIAYHFNDMQLLQAALTHRSVTGNNNERLEFLGDSIINFIIAKTLYELYPKAREGHLSRIRANLINGDTLAELAREFDLGEYLQLGPGEMKSGGRKRTSILADAFEALIAAIYLDSDMLTCERLVIHWFSPRLQEEQVVEQLKDPKTRLQEYLQANKFPLPNYEIVDITGESHDQTFHTKCHVEGIDLVTTGSGSSRRRAEQVAAEAFLTQLFEKVSVDE